MEELLLLWSKKELDLVAHNSCTCCIDDDEDLTASQKQSWQLLSLSLLTIQEHRK
jgi:hypothetical protein